MYLNRYGAEFGNVLGGVVVGEVSLSVVSSVQSVPAASERERSVAYLPGSLDKGQTQHGFVACWVKAISTLTDQHKELPRQRT